MIEPTHDQPVSNTGLPDTVEVGNNFPEPTADDVRQKLLAEAQMAAPEKVGGGGGESLAEAGVKDDLPENSQPRDTETVWGEWWAVANAALRAGKGLCFNRKIITREMYGERSAAWADHLSKRYPAGCPEADLIVLGLGTLAMYTSADERPETDDDKKSGIWIRVKRVFLAMIGK